MWLKGPVKPGWPRGRPDTWNAAIPVCSTGLGAVRSLLCSVSDPWDGCRMQVTVTVQPPCRQGPALGDDPPGSVDEGGVWVRGWEEQRLGPCLLGSPEQPWCGAQVRVSALHKAAAQICSIRSLWVGPGNLARTSPAGKTDSCPSLRASEGTTVFLKKLFKNWLYYSSQWDSRTLHLERKMRQLWMRDV